MKRNAVAWAALVVSTAALVSSRGMTRPMPAAPAIPAESQKAARALSEAFEAVADFVKPSVVQISVQRKGGAVRIPGRSRQNPFQFRGPRRLDRPQGPRGDAQEVLRTPTSSSRRSSSAAAQGTGSGFVYDDQGPHPDQ